MGAIKDLDEGNEGCCGVTVDYWPSGTPRKFFHGIYLVYTRYIHFPWICQIYTWYIPIICFPDKILFSSI